MKAVCVHIEENEHDLTPKTTEHAYIILKLVVDTFYRKIQKLNENEVDID